MSESEVEHHTTTQRMNAQQIARLSILNFALHGAAHRRLLYVEQATQENSAAVTSALQQVACLTAETTQLGRSLKMLNV